jgi:hypothetical protein
LGGAFPHTHGFAHPVAEQITKNTAGDYDTCAIDDNGVTIRFEPTSNSAKIGMLSSGNSLPFVRSPVRG